MSNKLPVLYWLNPVLLKPCTAGVYSPYNPTPYPDLVIQLCGVYSQFLYQVLTNIHILEPSLSFNKHCLGYNVSLGTVSYNIQCINSTSLTSHIYINSSSQSPVTNISSFFTYLFPFQLSHIFHHLIHLYFISS